MNTKTIADYANVHVNTVRLYEQWGYISPVPRAENGYRQYTAVHQQQMMIARLAFRQELIQNNLRKRATKIVQLSGREQFQEALNEATSYFNHLKAEHQFVLEAIHEVEQLLCETPSAPVPLQTHQQMAQRLQLTEETLRNWERNGLYKIERNRQNRRQYYERDYQKLLMIRTLRSAHFSIAAILHLFEQLDNFTPGVDIKNLLNKPKFTQYFLHVTDQLELNLRKAMTDVAEIKQRLSSLIASTHA